MIAIFTAACLRSLEFANTLEAEQIRPFRIGVAACRKPEEYPFGKQTYYFEDLLKQLDSNEREEFFFFDPLLISSLNDTISGFSWDGEWHEVESTLPSVIYDRAFSGELEERRKIESFRSEIGEGSFTVVNPLGLKELLDDKLAFTEFLQKNGFKYLETYRSADATPPGNYFVKPIKGSGGIGVRKISIPTESAIAEREFLQEEAKLLSFVEAPTDLRVLIQSVNGKLKVTGRAIRMGEKGGIVSNLMSGGSAYSVEQFGLRYRDHKDLVINLSIQGESDCMRCAEQLQERFGDIMEIGFDVLFTEDRGAVILEANSRPSRWVFVQIADRMKDEGLDPSEYNEIRNNSCRYPAEFLLNAIR